MAVLQMIREINSDTLSPWILLSADKEVLVPRHQVVTIVNQ